MVVFFTAVVARALVSTCWMSTADVSRYFFVIGSNCYSEISYGSLDQQRQGKPKAFKELEAES
uniref:Secreted protein n=1 Tax=Oryza sativa subsp. japonica TaxID=39947 RepID=Q84NV0_ORYSJ|nr:hypothetical protein [Oryza sativa Japonica Group]